MKPRIRLRFGIWTCRSVFGGALVVGNGYSPLEAYREWLSLFRPSRTTRYEPPHSH